jgi:hypothetical protein
LRETIAELPMHLERTAAPRHLSDSHGPLEAKGRIGAFVRCYAESWQLLRRVPNLYQTRATKAYYIARENLVAVVLYEATEPGLKQSREAGTMETSEGCRWIPRTASFGATE